MPPTQSDHHSYDTGRTATVEETLRSDGKQANCTITAGAISALNLRPVWQPATVSSAAPALPPQLQISWPGRRRCHKRRDASL